MAYIYFVSAAHIHFLCVGANFSLQLGTKQHPEEESLHFLFLKIYFKENKDNPNILKSLAFELIIV